MTGPAQWGPLRVGNQQRRALLRTSDRGNGLEAIEVVVDTLEPVLDLTFLEQPPTDVDEDNIRITAPAGEPPMYALAVERRAGDREVREHLTVRLNRTGGAGTYRLALVEQGPGRYPGHYPKRGIDPRFSTLDFSFDPQHPVAVPAASPPTPPPDADDDAPVSYLARDYAGLRTLMLQRLAVTAPAMTDRHAADLAVALVELFAYAGDDLSYAQDAVATEAYLSTARRRISVRRHARLAGYRLHNGAHARAWVCVDVANDVRVDARDLLFATAGAGQPAVVDTGQLGELDPAAVCVYSPMTAAPGAAGDPAITLYASHSTMTFWAFGESDAVLCAGATSASLVDGPTRAEDETARAADRASTRSLELRPGDVIMLESIHDSSGLGPPDPSQRHAVRLTSVQRGFDGLYRQPIVEVAWAPEDHLPFDLRLSMTGTRGTAISCAQAHGNVILVGNGNPVHESVPVATSVLAQPGLTFAAPFPAPADVARHQARRLRRLYDQWRAQVERWQTSATHGHPLRHWQYEQLEHQFDRRALDEVGLELADSVTGAWNQAGALHALLEISDRYFTGRRVRAEELARQCETSGALGAELLGEIAEDWSAAFALGLDPNTPAVWGAASAAIGAQVRDALPVIGATGLGELEDVQPLDWRPEPDLLDSGPGATEFVVEMDDDQYAHLRLNRTAELPADGRLVVDYWVGNGTAGNQPAEAINALVLDDDADAATRAALQAVRGVRNPLPATGGQAPEDLDDAKRAIPGSYQLDQPRALRAADYERLATDVAGVARAASEVRYSGVHSVVDVCVQPITGEDPTAELLWEVGLALAEVRRLGDEVQVHAPNYRPVGIGLTLTLTDDADRDEVAATVAALMGSGMTVGNRPALFHPSRLAFGQSVWASAVVAAVQDLPGVTEVDLDRFAFADDDSPAGAPPVMLALSGMQLARLDNDPDHPERGSVSLTMRSGR